jgi:hypothetical protein
MTSFNTTYDDPALGRSQASGSSGAFTISDFNRLRRSTPDAAVPIAAGVFLDVFNVFLLAPGAVRRAACLRTRRPSTTEPNHPQNRSHHEHHAAGH